MTTLHPDKVTADRLTGKPTSGGPQGPHGDGTLFEDPAVRTPLVLNNRSLHDVTEIVCGYAENSPGKWWLPTFMFTATVAGVGTLMILYLLVTGVGVWGLNNQVGWAWDITNFVFWIGIGHAGTLISAILCLFKQKWRRREPLRRGDDDLRRHVCGHLPGHPRRAYLVHLVRLPDPQLQRDLAQLPVAAAVGRFRGQHLRDRLGGSSGSWA